MKRRIFMETKVGERDVRDVWKGRIDGYVEGILSEIEGGGSLTYSKLERIYNHFNAIAEVDEKFEFVGGTKAGDEVVIWWPEVKWGCRFRLR